MDEKNALAAEFEANRTHLRAVAYRMLGSRSDADDAVQQAWLRLNGTDESEIQNLGGWLTTVVARICLDMLRARKSRREQPEGEHGVEPTAAWEQATSPEADRVLADSVGVALLVVLETLTPPERLAFVLHDMFDVPFEEIASIVGGSPAAARQLASRARRRVQGAPADPEADADISRQRQVVDAFLAASRSGDLAALLALLDPDVIVRADNVAVAASAAARAKGAPILSAEARGAAAAANTFLGRAQASQTALIDGSVGAVWAPGGQPRVAFCFTLAGGKVVAIEVVADPTHLGALDVEILPR